MEVQPKKLVLSPNKIKLVGIKAGTKPPAPGPKPFTQGQRVDHQVSALNSQVQKQNAINAFYDSQQYRNLINQSYKTTSSAGGGISTQHVKAHPQHHPGQQFVPQIQPNAAPAGMTIVLPSHISNVSGGHLGGINGINGVNIQMPKQPNSNYPKSPSQERLEEQQRNDEKLGNAQGKLISQDGLLSISKTQNSYQDPKFLFEGIYGKKQEAPHYSHQNNNPYANYGSEMHINSLKLEKAAPTKEKVNNNNRQGFVPFSPKLQRKSNDFKIATHGGEGAQQQPPPPPPPAQQPPQHLRFSSIQDLAPSGGRQGARLPSAHRHQNTIVGQNFGQSLGGLQNIPPQYVLDQNFVQNEILKQAAAGLAQMKNQNNDLINQFQDKYGKIQHTETKNSIEMFQKMQNQNQQHIGSNPQKQMPIRFRSKNKYELSLQNINTQLNRTQALINNLLGGNLTAGQIAQIGQLLDQHNANLQAQAQQIIVNDIIPADQMIGQLTSQFAREMGPLLPPNAAAQLLQQPLLQPPQAQGDVASSFATSKYTLNQRGNQFQNQKLHDRQRIMDFYSSIKYDDHNDQAKLRSQAIAQAPELNPHKLRFHVVHGNNARLIKNAMLKRSNFWLETTNSDPHFHFRWQPCSPGIKYDMLGKDIQAEMHPCQKQLVNHCEGHSCLSEKSKLFGNVSRYCSEKINENCFDFLPLTYFIECDLQKQKQYSKSMVQFMNAFYALDDISKRTKKFYDKIDGIGDKKINDDDENLQASQKIDSKDILDDNYIFKHFYQNKILMIRQHKKEEREEKEAYMEHQQAVPKVGMPSGYRGNQTVKEGEIQPAKVLKKYFFRQSIPFCHYTGHNLWILKATKLNQGQGIHVCNSLPQVKALIQKYCEGFPKKLMDGFQPDKTQTEQKMPPQKNNPSLNDDSAQVDSLIRGGDFRTRYSKSIKRDARRKSQSKLKSSSSSLLSPRINQEDEKAIYSESESKQHTHPSPQLQRVGGKSPNMSQSALNSPAKTGVSYAFQSKNAGSSLPQEVEPINENDMENLSENEDFGALTLESKESKKPGQFKEMFKTPQMETKKLSFRGNQFNESKNENKNKLIDNTRNLTSQRDFFEPKYRHNSFIVQKYIERPLLIGQRKFDIRIWVGLDSEGNAYYCKSGYLRTSSKKFVLDPDDPDNRLVHLTNVAIQKNSDQYGEHEDGNILNMKQFQDHINENFQDKENYVEGELTFKMKQQIARTLFATRKAMDPHKRVNNKILGQSSQSPGTDSNFFELFGYDFMIDEDFNVWLIEVNTNPSLQETSHYLSQLVPRMIDDLMKLTVDQVFMQYYKAIVQNSKDREAKTEQLNEMLNSASHHLEEFPDDQNVWEKLVNIQNRPQRREAKLKYLTPVEINSTYAFNIKGRDFRIKKYIQVRHNQYQQHMQQQRQEMELKLDDDKEDAEADGDEVNEGQGAKKSITVNIEQLGN